MLVCDGEILARAHNQKESLADPTAHAEMLVIRAGAQKLAAGDSMTASSMSPPNPV